MSRSLLRKTSHDKLIMSNFIFDLLPFKQGRYLSITLSPLLPNLSKVVSIGNIFYLYIANCA